MIANALNFATPILHKQNMERKNALSDIPQQINHNALASYGGPTRRAAAVADNQMGAYIQNGLIERGMPEHIAEAYVWNMQDESGLDAGINELSPLVKGSRGGFGLSQWTGPRRRAYEAYAGDQGVALDDVDAQLDFLMHELGTSEAGAARRIYATNNTNDAADAILRYFLRPAPEHVARRSADYRSR